jgi:hypothetical protein
MALIERKISVQAKVPVLLRDSTGAPITGVAHGDVTVKYRKYGQTSFTAKAVDGSKWFEVGNGWYDILFTTTELNTLKDFNYIVTEASAIQWNGFAEIIPQEKSEAKTAIDSLLELLALNQFKVNEYQEYTYDSEGRTSTVTLKMEDEVAPTSTWLLTFTYNLDNSVSKMSVVKQ